MPIKYEEVSSYKRGDNWFERQIKIIIDDYNPPYEKVVSLTDYVDKPEVMKHNLDIQTDLFISEIKGVVSTKESDLSDRLSVITVEANEKYSKDIVDIKAVK